MLGKLFARLARPAPRIDAQPDWDKARAILSQQGYFHMEAARDTELCAAYFEGLTLYRREQARGHSAGSFSTLIRNGAQQSFVLFAVEEAGNKEVCRVAHIIIEARDYYRPLPTQKWPSVALRDFVDKIGTEAVADFFAGLKRNALAAAKPATAPKAG